MSAPWARPAAELARELGVVPERGLELPEVRRRRRRHGPNRLRRRRRRSVWRMLWDQFATLVVALLGAAALVALAFGEVAESAAIAAVLLINATIGFMTERRAVRSMEALRELGGSAARVRRGGRVRAVPAEALVPGDVVVLEAGDVLTADLRLVEASRLQADESALTGESLPVDKAVEPVPAETPLPERSPMLFKGTAVTRGAGEGVVVATGMSSELGRISALVDEAEPETTPLEKRLDALARRLIGLTLAIAALVGASTYLSGRELYFAVEIGIALAVAAIPEGLPIVATVALARGMWRMARRNALVERLTAVETLGSTTVILTDKTGTLTENRMMAVELGLADGPVELAAASARSPVLTEALRVGALCNDAELGAGVGPGGERAATGDPTEIALLLAADAAGIARAPLLRDWPELREIAFDPDTKRMATLHRHDGEVVAAVKGAAEQIRACGTRERREGGAQPLDDAGRARWLARADEMAGRGQRVLALATRTLEREEDFAYRDLVLLGLVGFFDPPRALVREAIAACRDAGIGVVMVTGDHGRTAWTVASALGLVDSAPVRFVDCGALREPADLSPAQARELLAAAVFARATPRQKLDLIALHQRHGAVVAMTGDGVNDAPALKKADIGVAMGRRGTQVAREAADMVLRDDRFETIVAAVAEGRAIFANIRKFVVYLMSCNVSEILAVGLASLFAGPLPLLPLQILFLNLVTDVFPALALGVGEGGPGLMRARPRDPRAPVLERAHWRRIFGLGGLIVAAVLGALAIASTALDLSGPRATTVAFLTLAMAQIWHVFNMRERDSGFLRNEITGNPWIWAAIAICLALIVLAVQLPGLARVLSLSDPGATGWGLAVAMSLLPLVGGQLALARRIPVD